MTPVIRPISSLSHGAGNLWSNYINLVDVRRENLKLRDDIRALNTRVAEAEETRLAYERLERLLDMRKAVREPMVGATVIAEDASPWFSTLVIDRGSASGIAEGMPVLGSAGVVGQIVRVSANSSRVLLLTDHSSGIASTIQRSRARGVVKGRGEGLCSLEFAIREEDVKVGDQVVTSGIGGIFPKGLPIGEVTMVKRGEYGVFQNITIRPAVDILHLEEVLVVLKAPRV
jgi:rod shape-determining protein MreC